MCKLTLSELILLGSQTAPVNRTRTCVSRLDRNRRERTGFLLHLTRDTYARTGVLVLVQLIHARVPRLTPDHGELPPIRLTPTRR